MKEESLYQKRIFDIYYSLGNKRTLKKLRDKLKDIPEYANNIPSLPTLKSWSKKYNWQLRIQQRDAEFGKEIDQAVKEEILDIKANYRKVIRAILDELNKSLKQYQEKTRKVDIRSIRDFKEISIMLDVLINLDMNLLGESIKEPVQIVISNELLPKDD